ncbi:putative endo-beta-1,4-xylanase [Zymoseptoria tritici IPO323]|uniref:Beta-xylanase n=1 Tax=Zymoseptoria tritici (strain CBS 115943 / IPO323) TaxID=336722 RepID=F9XFH3_ZYMTI|nr:putative endo-beta-1,4-xylanase [Zymoseptoria tritici IPO323]EGP85928.1 putative endo-beta-1,4-xylanase [Zymoseptoria tritici IPO323]
MLLTNTTAQHIDFIMLLTNSVLAALAMAGNAVATPHAPKPKGLWEAMQSRGRDWIGTAVTFRNDTVEASIYGNKADFNSITPENDMKWGLTEPQQNNFTLAGADKYADYARKHGVQIHCHNLVWHSQLPDWVANGNFTKAELTAVMKNHIDTLAGRYKDVCTRWDVVNEALEENGTYRNSVFYRVLGEDFLPIAFKLAHAASPKSKLFYNDYSLEGSDVKAAGAQRIVKYIQSKGGPIHGVGFQAHLTSEPTTSSGGGVAPGRVELTNRLQSFTALGVDVAYTELDVRMNTPATPAKTAVQAEVYYNVSSSCLATKRCVGMTLWGVSDKYSWIPGTFPGEGSADVWDENLQKKKTVYQRFLDGILCGGKK